MSSAFIANNLGYVLVSAGNIHYQVMANDVINPLGKGAFGVVFKCSSNGSNYALKQIDKSSSQAIKIKEEYETMLKVSKMPNTGNLVYAVDYAEDKKYFYIIMSYFDAGTLTSLINKHGIESEEHAIEYIRQVCYGLKLLHEMQIIHRDLKTDNILVNRYHDDSYPYPYYFAISDFGLSRVEKQNDFNLLTCAVGTCTTSAPEVATGIYDTKADIYSIGAILYKMLTGNEVFKGRNEKAVNQSKATDRIDVQSCFSKPLSGYTISLLEKCLQYDSNNRITPQNLYSLLCVDSLYANYSKVALGSVAERQYIYTRKVIELKPTQVAKKVIVTQKICDIEKCKEKCIKTTTLNVLHKISNCSQQLTSISVVNSKLETRRRISSLDVKPVSSIIKSFPFYLYDISAKTAPQVVVVPINIPIPKQVKQITEELNILVDLFESSNFDCNLVKYNTLNQKGVEYLLVKPTNENQRIGFIGCALVQILTNFIVVYPENIITRIKINIKGKELQEVATLMGIKSITEKLFSEKPYKDFKQLKADIIKISTIKVTKAPNDITFDIPKIKY